MTDEEIKASGDPLKNWTPAQIKSALKAHSKRELLIVAMGWRLKAEEFKYVYNQLLMEMDGNSPTSQTNEEELES